MKSRDRSNMVDAMKAPLGAAAAEPFGSYIFAYIGRIPVLRPSRPLMTSDDTFDFDKCVFEENPTWNWFVRPAYHPDLVQVGARPTAGQEFLFLVQNTRPGMRLKSLFSRPAGRPFDDADAAALADGQEAMRKFPAAQGITKWKSK